MKKLLHLEVIRILAILCVMFIHTGYMGREAYSCTSSNVTFVVSLAMACASAIGVDLFWMVSGSLLLGIDEDAKVVYRKRLPRILIVLFAFSVIRYLYDWFMGTYGANVYWSKSYGANAGAGADWFGLLDFIKKFVMGSLFTPYWFLYYYIAILLILPFLRKAIRGMRFAEWKYFAVFEVFFLILVPLFQLVTNFSFGIPFFIPDAVNAFILGYAAERIVPAEWIRKKSSLALMGLLIIVFVASEYFLTVFVGNPVGENRQEFIDVFVQPLAFCVMLLIRGFSLRFERSPKWLAKGVYIAGSCTFGLYLTEDYLRHIFSFVYEAVVPVVTVMPACVIWLLGCFLAGVIIVSVIKRIPGLGKMI